MLIRFLSFRVRVIAKPACDVFSIDQIMIVYRPIYTKKLCASSLILIWMIAETRFPDY